jgi:hypothetical protein
MIVEKDKSIDTIQATRKLFLKLIDGLSVDQLNQIPEGFNNNIIWNFAHVIVSQQILCYKLAGQPLKVGDSYVANYSKGTKPTCFIGDVEVALLKQQAVQLIDELIIDIEKGLLDHYTNYTTSFDVTLSSIDDAVKFLTMHEGLHLGYAMALKRIVSK